MDRTTEQRYGDVAVIFHWLIAFFIIGLLAIGKYMVSLEDNDPIRFELTQWHKSFGLTVLFLSALRLVWRLTHRPPPDPDTMPAWQQKVASAVHIILYLLLFILPVTGWIMSSASPLNIDTVLFNVITIPHLPPFPYLPNKAEIAESFHEYHELASHLLILLLLAHIGAALKHHVIDKDTVLVRMLPDWTSSFKTKLAAIAAAILGSIVALYVYANINDKTALLAAGASEVSFTVEVSGDTTPGVFSETSVTASIDMQNPESSSIMAIVQTASVSSDNPQVEGSLPDTEWFDVEGHPQALFESTAITAGDNGQLQVEGVLTIKTTTQPVSFPMSVSDEDGKQVARGEFTINRAEFDVGMASQETDEYVSYGVTIKFRFDVS